MCCRQKTVEQKTWCPCENGADGRRGTARGVWCGNCLWLRMGQNLQEVLTLFITPQPSTLTRFLIVICIQIQAEEPAVAL